MSKNKELGISIVIGLVITFIAGCSDNQSAKEAKIAKTLDPSKEYKFYPNGCTANENSVCLSQDDYKAVCFAASGATKMASSVLAMYSTRANYLLNNGSVDFIKTTWNDSYRSGCRMDMQVSGIYQGSSARDTVTGGVSTFIVKNDGKILVHHASEGIN